MERERWKKMMSQWEFDAEKQQLRGGQSTGPGLQLASLPARGAARCGHMWIAFPAQTEVTINTGCISTIISQKLQRERALLGRVF